MISSDFIGNRIAMLRIQKNISARDMSLSLGQSQSYINNIENHKALPSMQMFLHICEFLEIQPKDFFTEDMDNPHTLHEVLDTLKPLTRTQLELLMGIARQMK